MLLEDQTQPLTVAEFTILVNRELGRHYDKSTLRLALNELVAEKRAVMRTETLAERFLRSSEKAVPGTPSAYYFSTVAGAAIPPARTVAIAVEGVDLSQAVSHRNFTKKRGRPVGSKNRNTIAAAKTADASSTVELLIEQLVAERTRNIQAELDDANAKLAQLKKLLAG